MGTRDFYGKTAVRGPRQSATWYTIDHMSIFATCLSIEHPDDWIADLRAQGIEAGVIGDDSEERELGSPWVYRGSHILPRVTDDRGGALEVAAIPNHITRAKRDDGGPGLHDWLRVSVSNPEVPENDENVARPEADATVLIDRAQVEALRDTLTLWLDRPADVRERDDAEMLALAKALEILVDDPDV
jgi:hypothetical protein